jgi:IS4 transposase
MIPITICRASSTSATPTSTTRKIGRTIGRTIGIVSGATYVFDKGYVHYKWWTAIHQAGSFFVTRPKGNMGLRVVKARDLQMVRGDGFTVLADEEVALASKGDSKLPIPLRRIRVQRDSGKTLSLLTNDMTRSAVAIAALYKARWQIELLFRWIKQHLKFRKFLGHNENAIKLQIYAAVIAYALLRLAAEPTRSPIPSCGSPTSCANSCSNDAISPPSKSPHPSIRVGNKTKARPTS